MCQITELCIEILAMLFLISLNLNLSYFMLYQAMEPLSHLGESDHLPQQEMGGLIGKVLVLVHLCTKLHQVAFKVFMFAFRKYIHF